jgi:hypothetical protein
MSVQWENENILPNRKGDFFDTINQSQTMAILLFEKLS